MNRTDRRGLAASDAGAGLEAHEAVGSGRGGVDDLRDVDADPVGEDGELIDEHDVDRAEDALQQLAISAVPGGVTLTTWSQTVSYRSTARSVLRRSCRQ